MNSADSDLRAMESLLPEQGLVTTEGLERRTEKYGMACGRTMRMGRSITTSGSPH